MLNQRTWRIAGGVFLLAAGFMAWTGARYAGPASPGWWLIVYWGSFVLLILLALYCALLDVKYTRLQFKIAERSLFEETLGSPEVRQAIRDAESRKRQAPPGE